MERLRGIGEERERVLHTAQEVAAAIRGVASRKVDTLDDGILMLSLLRKVSHEEINQLLHEALILDAAAELEEEHWGKQIEWWWNPRQTGTIGEPDLQGTVAGAVVISAEATASEYARGTMIDRMVHTLQKLDGFAGHRIYCVRTEQMRKTACAKVEKLGLSVEVRLIHHEPPIEITLH